MNLSLTRRDLVFLLLAGLNVLAYVLVAHGGFPLDDSWIHQTYGRNLGTRGEWAFLPEQPSAASTSPLYTVLLSIGYALRIPFMWWTHALGALALGLTAMIGARIAARFTVMPKHQGRVAWVAGLALLGSWHLIWAASSGMETVLFSMWTLILIWLALRETDDLAIDTGALLRRGAIYGVCVGLAALARPEGVLLGGVVAVLLLLVRPHGTLQRVIIWGVGAAITFFIVLAPYLWINWQITGGFLPNTASAKFEQHAILLSLPLSTRIWRLVLALAAGGQALLVIGVIAFSINLVRRRENLFAWLPLLWSISLILLYAVRLPADYQHGRYVMPALPAFIVIGVVGMFALWEISRRNLIGRVLVQTIAISTAIVTLYYAAVGATIYRANVAVIDGEMVKSAEWIDANIPEDELLAIHDIGAVGYFTPRPMLDIAGLVSEEVVPIVADADALWQLMEERGAVYLMAFPDQIPGRNPQDPRLCPIYSTDTQITRQVGGSNMTIYRLAYDGDCAT